MHHIDQRPVHQRLRSVSVGGLDRGSDRHHPPVTAHEQPDIAHQRPQRVRLSGWATLQGVPPRFNAGHTGTFRNGGPPRPVQMTPNQRIRTRPYIYVTWSAAR